MFQPFTHRLSARRLLIAAQRRAADLERKAKATVSEHYDDGALLLLRESRPATTYSSLRNPGPAKYGDAIRRIRMGPNEVHAFVTHDDGSIDDVGLSLNLLTNIGDMVLQGALGGAIPAGGTGSPATTVTTTAVTATATPWTASNLATPQLGIAGFRIYASVTGATTAPVYANVISNTTSVATIDQWWNAADGVGTTPANTNAFILGAGGIGSIRFMGLTTDAAGAAATDLVLATEITTNGGSRALATFARGSNPSGGSGTFTLQKAFSITGTFTAIHKMGLFCSLTDGSGTTAAHGGPVILETVLNGDVNTLSGDTLTVTDSVTLAG